MNNNDKSRDAAISIEKKVYGYIMTLHYELPADPKPIHKVTFIQLTAYEALQTSEALSITIIS